MVDVARFFMEFCMDESCGKCIPCRAGHRADAPPADPDRPGGGDAAPTCEQLEGLCDMVKHTSLCGLGQSAPNPVLSTLRYFRDEYEALSWTERPAPTAEADGSPLAGSPRRADQPLAHGIPASQGGG